MIEGLTHIYDRAVGALNAAEPIWPMLIVLLAAVLIPAVQLATKKKNVTAAFALAMTVVAGFVVCYQMYTAEYGVYMGLFAFDAFSGMMMMIFLAVLFLVILISPAYPNLTKHQGEYYSLLMVAVAGMMFVASAMDLVSIFIGVELASISSYALVAMKKNDPRAPEAAVTYLIIGGISTGLTLYGLSLVYGLTGSTQLADLALYFTGAGFSWAFAVAFVTLVAGYGFKVAAVPFHMWAPDVYEGAATPVSSFLATGSKKMGFVVFMKIFLLIFIGTKVAPVPEIQWFFAVLAAVTMTVGNIIAISQTNIKRMLAYSSVAQAGYLMIMLAAASEFAASAGLFYMVVHVFMKGGAFIAVAALITVGLGENISDYRGLAKRAPLVAFAMAIFMFSLAGIPPLGGFMGKFFLFGSALFPTGGVFSTTWVWLVFVAVINSAISLVYYVRVVKAMYVEKGEKTKLRIPRTHATALVICVVALIILGLWPPLLLDWCGEAAAALFGYI
jgi:NADH-quinone oxidoreductase subunit N